MTRDRLVLADDVLDYLAERQLDRESETRQRVLALKHCLEKLPESQRLMVEKRYAPGGSVQRLAEEAGKSVGAISQSLYRIREALMRCVERAVAEEELA
jgi:RNA polymerase sigma-70 factor (ECF subfamily)